MPLLINRRRRRMWFIAGGAAIGTTLWLYDADFLLNAAGPEAPISRIIVQALHLNSVEYPLIVIAPLAVMMAAGAAAGGVLGHLVAGAGRHGKPR